MTAASKIPGIPHIVDLVLSHLDQPDVLILQRTSRNFWERASRVIYRSVIHHIYCRHVDVESMRGRYYLSCIEEIALDRSYCTTCPPQQFDVFMNGIINGLASEAHVQTVIEQCKNLRKLWLDDTAWVEPSREKNGRPIIHERKQAMLAVNGDTHTLAGDPRYAWTGFERRQTQSLTEDFAHIPPVTDIDEVDDDVWGHDYEAMGGNIDRSRQLAVLYDPRKLGRDVVALNLIYSPIDLERIGDMMAERSAVGARPISSLVIDNPITHDLEAMLQLLRRAGDSLTDLSLGRNWTATGEAGNSPSLRFCDLPAILVALDEPGYNLARMSLTLCFDPQRDAQSLAAVLRNQDPSARRLTLQGLNLNVVFTLSSEHGGDPAKAFPAFDLARLLVSRTHPEFRVRIRHQVQFDMPGVALRGNKSTFSHQVMMYIAGFVRYLHSLDRGAITTFNQYLQQRDEPSIKDIPDMIALHMESVRPLPAEPSVQDIFYLYAAVANAKVKLEAANAQVEALSAGDLGGPRIASVGAGMGGISALQGIGLGMGAGGVEELAVEAVFAAELEAAERRLDRVMRMYSEKTGIALPIVKGA